MSSGSEIGIFKRFTFKSTLNIFFITIEKIYIETIDDGTATTTKWNEDATNVALRQSKLGGTTLPFRDLGTVTRKATTAGDGINRSCKFTNITNVQPYARNAIEKLKAFDPTLKNTNLDLSYDNQGRKGVWIGSAADGNRLTYKVTVLSTRIIEVTYSEYFSHISL